MGNLWSVLSDKAFDTAFTSVCNRILSICLRLVRWPDESQRSVLVQLACKWLCAILVIPALHEPEFFKALAMVRYFAYVIGEYC